MEFGGRLLPGVTCDPTEAADKSMLRAAVIECGQRAGTFLLQRWHMAGQEVGKFHGYYKAEFTKSSVTLLFLLNRN